MIIKPTDAERMADDEKLRDYFAGQALTGLLSNRAVFVTTTTDLDKTFVQMAYEIADAMMEARK